MVIGLLNTIKEVVIKKNSSISLKKTKDIKLSIQFSLGGFSFCVIDSISSEYLFFTSYTFKEFLNTPENLLKKIESIFKKDTNLQLDFKSVEVIHSNNLSTLVPKEYFQEEKLANYLDFNIKTLKTDFITFDEIKSINANNVYIPYVNINNYIFQHFGEFDFKHQKTVLIEKLIQINSDDEKVMYVNVENNSFEIIVFENKSFIFSNNFNFDTKEDFIYYILFTAEQLEMNPEKFNLYFTGDIEKESEIFNISYTYIKNISFLESKNPIFENLDDSKHSNFILLGI